MGGWKISLTPFLTAGGKGSYIVELKTKRCGVTFGDLTAGQVAQIKHVIETYASSKVQG